MFASKTTRGFYVAEIHGARTILVADPEWVRPEKQVTVQPGEILVIGDNSITNNSKAAKVIQIPDMEAVCPVIEMENPQCGIPLDAVEITDEEHASLIEGQSNGKLIDFDEAGRPFLAEQALPPPLTVEQIEAQRLAAYADPVAGSDRFFAEVSRMQAMGEAGWEALRDQGAVRYAEIKAEYPWPA